jgi:hypothetical protein
MGVAAWRRKQQPSRHAWIASLPRLGSALRRRVDNDALRAHRGARGIMSAVRGNMGSGAR